MALRSRVVLGVVAALAAVGMLASCSRADEGGSGAAAQASPAAELRLGYFPNITHAPALIGVSQGFFAQELGQTKLTTQTFNAGPDEVNALLGRSLDVAFIGSSPAINAYAKSKGEAIRLIAGSTVAGAQLVTTPDITSPAQLKGKTIATPQAGNTQDVALKKWLKQNNLAIGSGPDAVTVQNIDNPRTLDLFKQGQVAGAWLPEPWSSRLVDAGAKVLVDEKNLWPNGRFPTTVIIVRTEYLQQHPQTIEALLRGEQKAIDLATSDPAKAKSITNDSIKQITGSSLSPKVLDRAFSELTFDADPLASTFPQLAKDSVTAGATQTETNLQGFLDVTALNAVRQAAGKQPVDAAGLSATQN